MAPSTCCWSTAWSTFWPLCWTCWLACSMRCWNSWTSIFCPPTFATVVPVPKIVLPDVKKSPIMNATSARPMITSKSTDLLLIFSNVAIDLFDIFLIGLDYSAQRYAFFCFLAKLCRMLPPLLIGLPPVLHLLISFSG